MIHCLCLRIRTSDLPIQASERYKIEHLFSDWGHRPFMLVKKLWQKMKTKLRYLLPETVQVSSSIKFVQDEAVVIEVVCATHYTPSNNWWRSSSRHIRLVVQGGHPILGSPSDSNIDRHSQAVFAVTPRGQARLATAPSRRGTEIMNQNYFILPLVGTYVLSKEYWGHFFQSIIWFQSTYVKMTIVQNCAKLSPYFTSKWKILLHFYLFEGWLEFPLEFWLWKINWLKLVEVEELELQYLNGFETIQIHHDPTE